MNTYIQFNYAAASCASLPLTTRASSNATLLSEVISLTRLKPNIKMRNKHSRLRESMECDQDEGQQEVTLAYVSAFLNQHFCKIVFFSKEEESLSISSTATLTQQETTLTVDVPATDEAEEVVQSTPSTPNYYTDSSIRRSSTLTLEKDTSTEKGASEKPTRRFCRRLSNVSTTTMTKVRESPETCSKSDPVQYFELLFRYSINTLRTSHSTAHFSEVAMIYN